MSTTPPAPPPTDRPTYQLLSPDLRLLRTWVWTVLFVVTTALLIGVMYLTWAEGNFAITWHRTPFFFVACLLTPLLAAILGLGWSVVVIGLFESLNASRLADGVSSRLGGLMVAFTLVGLVVPIGGFAYAQWQMATIVQDLLPLLMADEMAALRPKNSGVQKVDWKYEGEPPPFLATCQTHQVDGHQPHPRAKGIIVDCAKRPMVLPAHLYLPTDRRAGADEVSWVAFACSNRVLDAWTHSHGFYGTKPRADVEQVTVTIVDRRSEVTLATAIIEQVPSGLRAVPNTMSWTNPIDVANFVIDCLGRTNQSAAPAPPKDKAQQQ